MAVLRAEIAGRGPGERLPSTRQLTARHHVSPVTVSRALAALAAEGLVVARPGAGTFVAAPAAPPSPPDHSWQTVALAERAIDTGGISTLADPAPADGLISLSTGYLHGSLMPTRALGAAWARAGRLPDAWERPPTTGLHGLRTWFAHSAGPGIDAGEVTITPGGQAAISAVFRAVVPRGGPLLVESPTYPGALAIARAAGIRPVPVPIDQHGVIPDLLFEAFARTGAQALYLQPTYQNPTAAVLGADRRSAVLAAAASAGAFVIEDDFARWLAHDRRPPPPLLADDADGRVVYLTSLTKVTSPSLRVGAMIARGPVADRLRAQRVVDDGFVGRPVQEATLELVSRAAFVRHAGELAAALRGRRQALTRALAEHLPEAAIIGRPAGGMHLWLALPAGLDDEEVARAARQAGVVVMAGRSFYPAEAPGAHLRLTFSAAPAEADLDAGVRRLAAAIAVLS